MAQEVGGGDEFEAGGLDFAAQILLGDAVVCFADRYAVFRALGMVGDDQEAAKYNGSVALTPDL